MLLLAMVLALLCQILPVARSHNRKLEEKFGRAFIAQAVMEEMLTVPVESWPGQSWELENGYHCRVQAVALKEGKLYQGSVILESAGREVYRLETYLFP